MATFQFRLETLLRLKTAQRDQRRAELAEILAAESQLREQQEEIGQQLQTQYRWLRDTTQAGTLDVDMIAAAQMEVVHWQALMRDKQALLHQLLPHIQERRQNLIAADQEVRTLERLKAQQHEAHLRLENLRESRQLDEIALQTHVRKGD